MINLIICDYFFVNETMGCAPSVKKVSPSPTERNSINTVTANGIKSHENGLNGMSNGTNGINGTNEMNGTNGTNFDTNYSKFKNEPSLLSRQSTNPFENESEEDDDLDDSYVNGELDKYFDDGTDENDIKETSDYYDDHQNHMESNGKGKKKFYRSNYISLTLASVIL